MDILKTSTDWAKTEAFSAIFFIIFGITFIIASFLFWQLGKTEMAKAYAGPTLCAGGLLLIIGIGLFYGNIKRMTEFEAAYNLNATAFIESELLRVKQTLNEYRVIVFKAIPVIIIACALAILFLNTPVWRASLITTIAMMVVILLVDGTAYARIEAYNEQLILAQEYKGD